MLRNLASTKDPPLPLPVQRKRFELPRVFRTKGSSSISRSQPAKTLTPKKVQPWKSLCDWHTAQPMRESREHLSMYTVKHGLGWTLIGKTPWQETRAPAGLKTTQGQNNVLLPSLSAACNLWSPTAWLRRKQALGAEQTSVACGQWYSIFKSSPCTV